MSDLGDGFKDMKRDRQDRHARMHSENREVINACGIPFTDLGEALLFRERGKPKVDFYPSTGRWRVPSDRQTHRGGARAFLQWYAKAR